MMTPRSFPLLLLVGSLVCPTGAGAQRPPDVDAINRLIDRYGALEDSMNMPAQAQLMSPDRVWVAQGAGRRTDQAANMRIQQAGFEALKRAAPGIATFTEDRDRLIKFYANGAVAVASFFRYTTNIVPAAVAPDIARAFAAPVPPAAITLVLEKRDGDWKIVHTHTSALGAPPGD